MRIPILCTTLLALFVAAAGAADHFPLETGWTWSYRTPYGWTETVTVTAGTQVVQGVETRVLERVYTDDFGAYTLLHFLSEDAYGGVLLHGYRNLDIGSERSFVPPVLLLPGAPSVGATWSTPTTLHDGLHDLENPIVASDYTYRVVAEESIGVPAGVFSCLRVEAVEPDPSAARVQAEGTWYCEAVGIVKSGDYDLLQYDAPVGTANRAWGTVKSFFH